MAKVINHSELVNILKTRIRKSNCNALAKKMGFSQEYIHQVTKGKKKIASRLALKLGFKPILGTFQKL